MNKIKPIIDHQLKKDLPEFSSGDTISVDVRVVEGGKDRFQKFEGIVISTAPASSGIRDRMLSIRSLPGGMSIKR